jgi:hypothetical protein
LVKIVDVSGIHAVSSFRTEVVGRYSRWRYKAVKEVRVVTGLDTGAIKASDSSK